MKNKVSNLGTYLIGGKASVSDETRDKAINALRNSKTFAGSWNWVNSGDQKDPNAPLVADSEKVEVTAGADKAVEIKLKASGKVDATAELVGAAPAGYLVEVKEGVVYIKVTAEATDAKLTFKNAADKITSIYVTVKKAPEQPNKDNSEKDNGKQDGGKQTPPADK